MIKSVHSKYQFESEAQMQNFINEKAAFPFIDEDNNKIIITIHGEERGRIFATKLTGIKQTTNGKYRLCNSIECNDKLQLIIHKSITATRIRKPINFKGKRYEDGFKVQFYFGQAIIPKTYLQDGDNDE